MLSAHGLDVALESLAARAPVPVRLTVTIAERPPPAVEVAAYYVVSEALANIGKHAQATAAQVCVERQDSRLVVDVRDNGRGGAQAHTGSGLDRLGLRVEALGGRLSVRPADGGGVQVHAGSRVPEGEHRRGQRAAREGLTRILTESGLDVIAAYDNADDLLNRLKVEPPDIALLDIRLPPTHTDEGMRAALTIRREHPAVSVLVLSQYVELGLAMQLLSESAEGVGYLLKDRIGDVADFLDSIRPGGRGRLGDRPADRVHIAPPAPGRQPHGAPHSPGAGGARADGRGQLQRRDRVAARHHPAGGREVRVQRVRQARDPVHGDGVPARPRGAALPPRLSSREPSKTSSYGSSGWSRPATGLVRTQPRPVLAF